LASEKKSGRRIFVGDVHGCADELQDLLTAVEFRKKRDELWFTGDIVNRGPASLDALEMAMELGTGAVLGNHDLHLLMFAEGLRSHGKRDTLKPILKSPRAQELLDWLRHQPLVKCWDDILLVHGGLHPRWKKPKTVIRPVEKAIRKGRVDWDDEDLGFVTSVRRCDRKGRRPPRGRRVSKRFRPWDDHYDGKRTVVFGHWAARGLVERKRVRGLDSGCVWGGSLTAWIAEEDRFVSVPSRDEYQRVG